MSAIGAWLDDRLRVRAIRDFLAHKDVPAHDHAIWYYLGGVTLFLYCIQVATGVLLLLYYRPSPETAFESVRHIMANVPFGWLVRSLHAWAANLMVAAAFSHFFSVFFLKAYRAPREPTWMTGCLLLMLTLVFGFSGYLLPWNELAYFATNVGTDIVSKVPVVGEPMLHVMRGGDRVSGATLTRLFGVHVALLPLLTTLLLLVHLALVQVHGMSEPEATEGRPAHHVPFYPDFILREAFLWLLILAVLIGLATFLPWELGTKADPFAPAPAGIRPEWYFTFLSQSLKYVPAEVFGFEGEQVAIMGVGVIALGLFTVPFFDRAGRRPFVAAACTVFGVALLGFMMTMTALAYLKPY
jgi:cytochrome b6